MSGTVKKSTVVTSAILLVVVLLSALLDSYIADAVMATIILVWMIRQVNAKSGVHVMFLVGFSVFTYFPALMNGYAFNTSFALFYATSTVSFVFLQFAHGMEYKPPLKTPPRYFGYFFGICIAVVGASLVGEYASYLLAPLAMFYAMCLNPGHTVKNILLFLLFFCTFSFFYIVGWTGYGRTVIFGILIVGILYFFYAQGIRVVKFAFAFVPVVGSLFLAGRKDSYSFDLNAAVGDSAIGPYRLASTFIEINSTRGFDLIGFFDQLLFTLFSFVPRSIWPSKPFGFGFQFVVENMDQSFVDEGHSIASTLIGDHIYFLGWWGIFTGVIMAYVIAKMCRFAYSLKLFNGFGVVIFTCSMMVLVWGGMTSFSARVIFPLIAISPFLFVYFLGRLNLSRR